MRHKNQQLETGKLRPKMSSGDVKAIMGIVLMILSMIALTYALEGNLDGVQIAALFLAGIPGALAGVLLCASGMRMRVGEEEEGTAPSYERGDRDHAEKIANEAIARARNNTGRTQDGH